VQLVYRLFHATESALLKVVKDLFVSVDEKDVATVLALPDQGTAFDLVDHPILIDRLSSKFCFCALTLVWFRSYLSN
jgi:hypothetical protein